MEQTNNNYPKFEEGQVLTSQALNNYFGYLDEQQRLTRAKLLGVGIIDGLEYELSGNKLIIRKGTAVTADGYLINLPEDTSYTLAYEYNKQSDMLAKRNPLTEKDDNIKDVLNHVRYVLYKDESDAAKHNQSIKAGTKITMNLSQYIISLMIDFISQDTITKCSELSCDIVQSNYIIEIRPILLDNKILGSGTTLSISLIDNAGIISNIKPNDIQSVLDLNDGLSSKISQTPLTGHNYESYFNKVINTLLGNLKSLKKNIEKLKKNYNDKKQLYPIQDPAKTVGFSFNSLEKHINQFEKLTGTNPGYYIQHLFNIETAIEEFADYYRDFAFKYDIIPYEIRSFSRIVMLGQDKYSKGNTARQYNDSILHDKKFIADLNLLQKAFDRIFLLAKSFNKQVSFTSFDSHNYRNIHPNAKLGERIKPQYYDFFITGTNDSWWTLNINNFETNRDLAKGNFDRADSLEIENYYYWHKSTFRDVINRKIEHYHLPITVEYIPVGDIKKTNNKYKTNYTRDGLIDVFLELNGTKKTSFDIGKPEYKLKGSWKTIFTIIDREKSIDANDARKYLDIIKHGIENCVNDKNSHLFEKTYRGYTNTCLQYCIDYLNHYAICSPIQVGSCPFDGKLTVFYTNDDEEKVLWVVGSYTEKNEIEKELIALKSKIKKISDCLPQKPSVKDLDISSLISEALDSLNTQ